MNDIISRQVIINMVDTELISRQTAIDALNWTWAGKTAIEVIRNLPSAEPENQWIPCSERLPGCWIDVLVCTREKHIYIMYLEPASYLIRTEYLWSSVNGDYFNLENVIAWMSLPKPCCGADMHKEDKR